MRNDFDFSVFQFFFSISFFYSFLMAVGKIIQPQMTHCFFQTNSSRGCGEQKDKQTNKQIGKKETAIVIFEDANNQTDRKQFLR